MPAGYRWGVRPTHSTARLLVSVARLWKVDLTLPPLPSLIA